MWYRLCVFALVCARILYSVTSFFADVCNTFYQCHPVYLLFSTFFSVFAFVVCALL